MELNQAIMKMEQGGSADGILQVRADRIQSDLEELLRALSERTKKHGVHIKSAAVMELPQGWQPGVPEVSAVWDEDWDKFEDQGGFHLTLPCLKMANLHLLSMRIPLQSTGSHQIHCQMLMKSQRSLSVKLNISLRASPRTAIAKMSLEKAQGVVQLDKQHLIARSGRIQTTVSERDLKQILKHGGALMKRGGALSIDTDSVWGFSNNNAKDLDHDKNGENYFFGSSEFASSPRRTDSPSGDSMFQKKSAFGFDESVPGSPGSRAGNSPRYSGGGTDSFFDNMSSYDSFSATQDRSFSMFDSISSSAGKNSYNTQDRSFSRFDSMSSNAGQSTFGTQDRGF